MAVPEMGKYLRQIVDNPLEEGQFENAISMLDDLRSPNHTPSTIHILHLIFIALHPVSHPCRLDQLSDLDNAALLLQSPRKIIKQTKSALVLSPSAVLASQSLLHSFLRTNGPAALAPALPVYPETKNAPPVDFEYVDSPIYKQATAVKNARTVWDILKSGYVNKTMYMFGTPRGRGKQPRSSTIVREPSFSLSVNEWEGQAEILPVGDDSWPLLDWIVTLFENDAELTEKSGLPKHSPLLLKQFPPPPVGSITRWDASEPLKVVFYALQQTEDRRQRIGLRLLHLLIDLTQTPYLNLPSFTSTVLSQLAASPSSLSGSQFPSPIPSAPTTPPRNSSGFSHSARPLTHQEALTSLFTHLSPTPSPSCLAFRMALCKKILAELEGGSGSLDSLQVNSKSLSGFGSSPHASNVNGVSPNTTGAFASAEQRPAGKPRPRPRPLTRNAVQTDRAPPAGDANAAHNAAAPTIPANNAVSPPTPLASANSTGSTSTVTSTPAPAPALPKAPLPPLPPLPEIARLLYLRAPTVSSSSPPSQPQTHLDPNPKHPRTAGRMVTRRSVTPTPAPNTATFNSNLNLGISISHTHPWTSPPSLLLRIKFEVLSAWIGMRTIRRGYEEKAGEKQDNNDDSELEKIIEGVFGKGIGGESESESERDDRLFYRDLLRAFAGLPVQV